MKTCTKCQEIKEFSEFNVDKSNKDGHDYWCKICRRKQKKEYRDTLGDEYWARRKKSYYKHHEKRLEESKRYAAKTKSKKAAYDVEYRARNKEKIAAYKKNWTTEKIKNNIEFRLKRNLRRRVHHALTGDYKSDRTFNLIGCDVPQFMRHIESQFVEGMTWDNYGKEWHIDHIIPCFTFDLADPEQQKQCFHYSNQRPLWAKDNLKRPRNEWK